MESNKDNNQNASNMISNAPQNEEEKKEEKNAAPALSISKTLNQLSMSVIRKDQEDLIKDKIIKLRRNYNFSMSYSLGILNILKLFNNCLFDKVTNTLNENKSILNLFKEISGFYQSFSEQVRKSNKTLSTLGQTPKIFDDGLKNMIESTQNALVRNFLDISNNVKIKIMAKGTMGRVDEICTAIENIRREIYKKIDKLERRRKKLEKLYKSKYEASFNEWCPIGQIPSGKAKYFNLEETPDFVLVELELSTSINKMYIKTNLYLTEIKDSIYSINMLVIEFSKIIRDSLMIYIQESKKIYTSEITQNFTQVEQYYEAMSKPGTDHSFKTDKIFHTPELQNEMNVLLRQYQRLLVDSKIVKNDVLYYDNRFIINYYANLELFFELLLQLNPQPGPVNYDDMIKGTYFIRRDPGFFSSWKNCKIIFTKQKHALIIDEPISNNAETIFEISKVTFKRKADKKNNYLFEVTANRKGKIMTSTGTYSYDAKSENVLKEIELLFIGGEFQPVAESQALPRLVNPLQRTDTV